MTKKTFAVLAVAAAAAVALSACVAHAEDRNGLYAGPTIGATFNSGPTLGLNVGNQFNDFTRLEATYDHGFNSDSISTDTLATNGILQYHVNGTKLTPYALAGLGYQFQNGGTNQGIWNVGGGSRIELAPKVDLDVRYRYVQGLTNANINSSVVTFGTTFKF